MFRNVSDVRVHGLQYLYPRKAFLAVRTFRVGTPLTSKLRRSFRLLES